MEDVELLAHERRVCRRLEARGEPGLGEALCRMDGVLVGSRFQIVSLYAVGSEGAVYLARDVLDRSAPLRVAKVALIPLHKPFELSEEEIRSRRDSLREESENLTRAASSFMPKSFGLYTCQNPSFESEWGGEFAEPEPVLVMERLPGFDLDLWLARMHSTPVPKDLLRRQLDHVAVVVLSALMDLADQGYYYTDLRPGNVRIRGRTKNRVRLMDAGSLVRVDDRSGKFPHVPAYLPPEMFRNSRDGELLLPSPGVQAVMAGRTLYEVATGRVPMPGGAVDSSALYGPNVSPSVAETIDRLCRGAFPNVTAALAFLSRNFVSPADERPSVASGPAPAPRTAPKSISHTSSRGSAVDIIEASMDAQRGGSGAGGVPSEPTRAPKSQPIVVPSTPPGRRRAPAVETRTAAPIQVETVSVPAPGRHTSAPGVRRDLHTALAAARQSAEAAPVTPPVAPPPRSAAPAAKASTTPLPPAIPHRMPESEILPPPRLSWWRSLLSRLFGA